ncbi:hypothetical protein GH714_011773 [Hevea brasiliensis]|uniref:Uncharacterized protein n=1 Tax=Hevea brasiliensis TaxID=3981 RepID=A0A6A6LJ60_HEVBR|nr:hypothetical protein GH714_011773 [Hevea brasiliensis]
MEELQSPLLIAMKDDSGSIKIARELATFLKYPLIDQYDASLALQKSTKTGLPNELKHNLPFETVYQFALTQLSLKINVIINCELSQTDRLYKLLNLAISEKARFVIIECTTKDKKDNEYEDGRIPKLRVNIKSFDVKKLVSDMLVLLSNKERDDTLKVIESHDKNKRKLDNHSVSYKCYDCFYDVHVNCVLPSAIKSKNSEHYFILKFNSSSDGKPASRQVDVLISNKRLTRVYEDFEPILDWEERSEDYTLSVGFPGFEKEEIEWFVDPSNSMIVLMGQRPTTDNKWLTCNKKFDIPKNGDVAKIDMAYRRTYTPKYMLPNSEKVRIVIMECATKYNKDNEYKVGRILKLRIDIESFDVKKVVSDMSISLSDKERDDVVKGIKSYDENKNKV